MRRRGFTLVEVLIVVVILGILGAIVSRSYSAAARSAREAALIRNLIGMRSVLLTFKSKLNGRFPETVAELNDTVGGLPVNPFNGGRAVRLLSSNRVYTIDENEEINGEKVGWLYHPPSGSLWANTGGSNAKGERLAEL